MKSYAQHTESKIVDWLKLIQQLMIAKGNNINDSEKDEEVNWLSKNWDTCPLGQSDVKIPRRSDGEPKDKILLILGQQFYCALNDKEFEDCLSMLDLIDQRVQYVVKQEDKRVTDKVDKIERKVKAALQKIKDIKTSLHNLSDYEETEEFLDNFEDLDIEL